MATVTILQVVPRLDTGGSEQATVEITEALTRAGASALVVTAGGRLTTAVRQAGGEVITLPVPSKNPFTMIANAWRLQRLIVERGVDFVHARSRAPAWSALLAARRTKRPFVTTYHGAYSNPGPIKAAYNSVMARGDRVIANSLYTAKLIAEPMQAARARIRVIYRGIESATFDPLVVPPAPVAKLRERWGVKPDIKIVLHAARLTGLKGHRHTIDAAAKLAHQGALDGAVVVFVGDAPGNAAYRQELIDPETIDAADRDASGFTGWLVPPGDSDSLAERIAAALKLTGEERSKIGARACTGQRVVRTRADAVEDACRL